MEENSSGRLCGACSLRCMDLHPSIKLDLHGFSFFKVMERDFSSCLEISIPIPIPFKFGDNEELHVLLMGQSGQLWAAKVCIGDAGLVVLRNGWETFVSDNCLNAGDVVVFNHIFSTHFVVQVFGSNGNEKRSHRVQSKSCIQGNGCRGSSKQIVKLGSERRKKHVRAGEEELKSKSALVKLGDQEPVGMAANVSPISSYRTPKKRKLNTSQTENAIVPINTNMNRITFASKLSQKLAESKNPNFVKLLTDSAVGKGYRLSIPKDYRQTWFKGINEVILTSHDDHSYTWKQEIQSYNQFYGFHSGGWKSFVQAHNLKKDDICIFELVDTNDLKVYVLKLEDQLLLEM